ncbi:MAG: UDP-2,3-diacylglucosamine diphosphatase [Planctomycetota bacterium]
MIPLAVIADAHVLPKDPGSWAFVGDLIKELPRPCRVLSLGDFFDFWHRGTEGHRDDYGPLFELISLSGLEWHFIRGNRDFMLTAEDARGLGATLHDEPLRWNLGNSLCTFIHGDLLLTADTSYLAFRRLIRLPLVTVLSRTLPRIFVDAVVGLIRGKLDHGKALKPYDTFQVDLQESARQKGHADLLMCGHTHKPLETELPGGGTLRVLPAFGAAGGYMLWESAQGWVAKTVNGNAVKHP